MAKVTREGSARALVEHSGGSRLTLQLDANEPFTEALVLVRMKETCKHYSITVPMRVTRALANFDGSPLMQKEAQHIATRMGASIQQVDAQAIETLFDRRETFQSESRRRKPSKTDPGQSFPVTYEWPVRALWVPEKLAQMLERVYGEYLEVRVSERKVTHENFAGRQTFPEGAITDLTAAWATAKPLPRNKEYEKLNPAVLTLDPRRLAKVEKSIEELAALDNVDADTKGLKV